MNPMRVAIFLLLGLLFCTSACAPSGQPAPDPGPMWAVPAGFPEPPQPNDNRFSPQRWMLGRALFYEKALSRDSSIACASCHDAAFAFSDIHPVSLGVEGRPGSRNTPPLANLAYHPHFMREGGLATLEQQVAVPIQEHAEMDFNMVEAAERLAADPAYRQAALDAYGRQPDPFVLTRALAVFERSLFSGASAYDAWTAGHAELPPSAERGRILFFSERTGCASCHGGFLFSQFELLNNGLYMDYADPGLERLTSRPEDRGRFKVPSLRNVGLTAPYMHDGSLPDIQAVLAHYNAGGKGHANQDARVRPLDLSQADLDDLEAFLHSLTDWAFVSEPAFQNPKREE